MAVPDGEGAYEEGANMAKEVRGTKLLADKTIEVIREYLKEKRTEYMERAFGYFEPDGLYRSIVGEDYDALMRVNRLWRTRPQSTSASFTVLPWTFQPLAIGSRQTASFEVTFKGYPQIPGTDQGPPIYLVPGVEAPAGVSVKAARDVSLDELRTDDTTTLPRMLEAEMQWAESINAFNHLMTFYSRRKCIGTFLPTDMNYLAPWIADIYAEHPHFFMSEPLRVKDTFRLRTYPKAAPLMPKGLLDICRMPQTLLAQLKILVSAGAPKCAVGGYYQPPGTAGVKFSVSSTRVESAFREMAEARSYSWR